MLTVIWDFLFCRRKWVIIEKSTVSNSRGEAAGTRFTLQCKRTGQMKYFNNYTVDMLGNGLPAPRDDGYDSI